MGSLFHPVGSQPAWVYWARRGVLVLAAVLVIGAVVFVLQPQPEGPVSAVPATTAASSPAVTAPATPTGSSSSATPSPTPTGPLACDATNSTLALAGYQKVKQDAKQPFRLTITNNGGEPCVLDVSPKTFALTVSSGTDRIWTTEDCAKWVPTHKQAVKPRQAYEFTIVWPVARSSPGCKTSKAVLGTGTYVADGTFASNAKARQVFVVTKAG